MKIKLSAKLSAYSKLDYIENQECEHTAISNEKIDSLFLPEQSENETIVNGSTTESTMKSISKNKIDSLFK